MTRWNRLETKKGIREFAIFARCVIRVAIFAQCEIQVAIGSLIRVSNVDHEGTVRDTSAWNYPRTVLSALEKIM